MVAYDSGLTAVQALNNGQVDAVVIDNAPAKEYVAANPGLKVLETSYAEEDYAIGMAKGSSLEDATGIHLTISAEDFTGGIRAVIRSRNILIDHSFKTALRNEYDKFLFSGGDSIV